MERFAEARRVEGVPDDRVRVAEVDQRAACSLHRAGHCGAVVGGGVDPNACLNVGHRGDHARTPVGASEDLVGRPTATAAAKIAVVAASSTYVVCIPTLPAN